MHFGQTRQAETAFREAEALFATGDNSFLDHRAENLMQLGNSLPIQNPSIKLPARPLKSSLATLIEFVGLTLPASAGSASSEGRSTCQSHEVVEDGDQVCHSLVRLQIN
jgi:hypothetical protein